MIDSPGAEAHDLDSDSASPTFNPLSEFCESFLYGCFCDSSIELQFLEPIT